MKKTIVFCCVCMGVLFMVPGALAQPPEEEVLLPEARVQALRFSKGHMRWTPDSLLLNNGLSRMEQLMFEQIMPIRTNGPSALALPVLRGLPASHMAVLWNGINLQSSMNGLLDLQLLNNTEGSMVLESGGNSMLYGSGSVSGVLAIENTAFDTLWGAGLLLRCGSFGNAFGRISTHGNLGKTRFNLNLFKRMHQNNMPYVNPYRQAEPVLDTLKHAAAQSQGIELNTTSRTARGIEFQSSIWVQGDHRLLPPTMLQLSNTAEQSDLNIRVSLIAQQQLKKINWVARLAWLDEQIRYFDLPKSIDEMNRSRSQIFRLETEYAPKKNICLSAIAQTQTSVADVSGYGRRIIDNRAYTTLMFEWRPKNWSVKLGNQLQYGNNNLRVLLPGAYIIHHIRRKNLLWSISHSTSLNYRLPTLNDRFWSPGGNPDLLPEQGLRSETGADLRVNDHVYSTRLYHYNMNNLIIWLPGDHGFWSPSNIAQTWSSGIEISAEQTLFRKKNIRIISPVRLNINRSISKKGAGTLDRWMHGIQNIYAPVFTGSFGLNVRAGNFGTLVRMNYQSARNVSAASDRQLEPFWLMHLSTQYSLKNVEFGVQIQNMLDVSYELLAFYPMPGLNGSLFISYRIKQK